MKPTIFGGLILSMALTAVAAPEESELRPEKYLHLQRTTAAHQLLELQRSGRMASREEQTLPGKAQTKIYQRYIDSFGHPIPETYISEDFSE